MDGLPNRATVKVPDNPDADHACQPGAPHFRVHLAGDRADVGFSDRRIWRVLLATLETEGVGKPRGLPVYLAGVENVPVVRVALRFRDVPGY